MDAVTHAERSPSVLRSLHRHELAAHRHRGAVGRELGVSEEELLVLLHLAEHGGSTQGQLGALLGLSRSGIGAMVQRLETGGLVERRATSTDKRIRLVQLAPRAQEQLDAAFAELSKGVARLLGRYDPEEAEAVQRFLDALAQLSEQQVSSPPSGAPTAEPSGAATWRLWR